VKRPTTKHPFTRITTHGPIKDEIFSFDTDKNHSVYTIYVFLMGPTLVCQQTIELSAASIHILSNDIAEVFVHNNAIVCKEFVKEYHQTLQAAFDQPFGLIINRLDKYEYSECAKSQITQLDLLKAVAMIEYPEWSNNISSQPEKLPDFADTSFNIFHDREEALYWLATVLKEQP